ncbi:uncharacterized protein FOMMEDRAFT_155130 [Fomitiporia mediterranea MF3/22]|uniref:uncharacterized protein n=1 Tax=Fomitiporia mediterranea (strain MF3/22) TaxID=694068 RepID=UPI00044079D7|nr:uncharacterized protein FOMMEDRAFT_155130 [Fomitiporia mediterranea MF3/22]EJD04007.1 hypothetical protein FOMMEDRAFT_155130 [Fomitiporia mediterranea MF3/22]
MGTHGHYLASAEEDLAINLWAGECASPELLQLVPEISYFQSPPEDSHLRAFVTQEFLGQSSRVKAMVLRLLWSLFWGYFHLQPPTKELADPCVVIETNDTHLRLVSAVEARERSVCPTFQLPIPRSDTIGDYLSTRRCIACHLTASRLDSSRDKWGQTVKMKLKEIFNNAFSVFSRPFCSCVEPVLRCSRCLPLLTLVALSLDLVLNMHCLDRLLFKNLVLSLLSFTAFGFNFSFTPPSSCDNLDIVWSGGTRPFSLLITPGFYVPQNISIPDSAFDPSSGNGSFSVQLKLPPGRKFLLTMSDSTGFEAGGTSDILTVGSSISGTNCPLVDATPDFFFDLNSALQQCRTSTFSGYDNATQPVTILGLIPSGQSFELLPPQGPSTFDWIVDVSTGTTVTFILTDALGRQGGSSDFRTVGISADSACISASSPHSTAQTPSALSSTLSSASPSGTQARQTVDTHSGPNIGIIVGAIVGGLAVVFLALLLSFCCLRRRKQVTDDFAGQYRPPIAFIDNQSSRIRALIPASGRARRTHSSVDLVPPAAMRDSSMHNPPLHQSMLPAAEDDYIPNPHIILSDAEAIYRHSGRYSESYPWTQPHSISHPPTRDAMGYAQSHSRSQSQSETDGFLSPGSRLSNPYSFAHARSPSVPYSTSPPASPGVTSPKASTRQAHRITPRVVQHTDAEDVGSSGEQANVVELPPQYTDRSNINAMLDDRVKGSDRSPK